MPSSRITVTSRIPQIIAQASARLPGVLDAAAERVAQGARERVAVDEGDLRDTIRVVRAGPLSREVRAGSKRVFYPHLVEWGSVNAPARPFMTPAAEAEAEGFKRSVGELFR